MSETARKTMRNTVLLTAFEVANPFVSLILIGTMSRHLGAEGLGAYNLLLNFFFVAHAFTSLGLNTLVTRQVSRSPGSASVYLSAASVLGLAVTLATGGGIMAIIRFAGYDASVRTSGWLVALGLVPSIIILQCESTFIAFEKIQYIVYVAIAENVGRTLLGLWLLKEGYGVASLVASFTLFRYFALLLNLIAFRVAIGPLVWRVEGALVRELIGYIPVFGGILVASTLYWRADVFLLSKMVTLSAVGYYTAAYRLFAIAQVLRTIPGGVPQGQQLGDPVHPCGLAPDRRRDSRGGRTGGDVALREELRTGRAGPEGDDLDARTLRHRPGPGLRNVRNEPTGN